MLSAPSEGWPCRSPEHRWTKSPLWFVALLLATFSVKLLESFHVLLKIFDSRPIGGNLSVEKLLLKLHPRKTSQLACRGETNTVSIKQPTCEFDSCLTFSETHSLEPFIRDNERHRRTPA